MDLNYLYLRRGQSLLMAAQASCEQARNAHLGLARGYVERIAELRREQIAAAASSGRVLVIETAEAA